MNFTPGQIEGTCFEPINWYNMCRAQDADREGVQVLSVVLNPDLLMYMEVAKMTKSVLTPRLIRDSWKRDGVLRCPKCDSKSVIEKDGKRNCLKCWTEE